MYGIVSQNYCAGHVILVPTEDDTYIKCMIDTGRLRSQINFIDSNSLYEWTQLLRHKVCAHEVLIFLL